MLYLNDVLEDKDAGTKLRVIHIDYTVGDVWLYDLGNDLAFPKQYSCKQSKPCLTTTFYRSFRVRNIAL